MIRRSAVGLCLLLIVAAATSADDPKTPIPPAEAQQHVGKSVAVEMVVKKAKKSVHRKTVFLDSHEDFNDPGNLGIAIDEQGEQALSQKFASTDLPAYFLNKSIRVNGTVVRRDDRTYIDVSHATQIELSPTQP